MLGPQIFFVSGAPKSGTTWAQRVLDAHPQVVCSGEGHFVAELVAPLMKLKDQYNKKLELVAERVYEGKPYYTPFNDADVAAVARSLALRLMSKRQTPDTKALGDKTPRYTDNLPTLLSLFPSARFIHMVRHPYDVAVSLMHHALRAGYEDVMTPGSKTQLDIVGNAARAWMSAHQKAAAFSTAQPGKLIQVRYEDLLDQPLASATAMFTHLGVRAKPAAVTAALEAASFEKLSGRKPGEENPRSFFRKGVAGDWKGRLEAKALTAINAICLPGMESEQYEVAS
ncbi:MAG: sulfotransferase family protein [Caulobacteraceae bacterium]